MSSQAKFSQGKRGRAGSNKAKARPVQLPPVMPAIPFQAACRRTLRPGGSRFFMPDPVGSRPGPVRPSPMTPVDVNPAYAPFAHWSDQTTYSANTPGTKTRTILARTKVGNAIKFKANANNKPPYNNLFFFQFLNISPFSLALHFFRLCWQQVF